MGRMAWIALGFALIALGGVGAFIPFTFHALAGLAIVGAIIVLRRSIIWRRRFVRLYRRYPSKMHRVRQLLRRRPMVRPVLWREVLRTERWLVPHRWRRLGRWRRRMMRSPA